MTDTTTLSTVVSIRASYARLAMTCAARKDPRPYLHGLLVEPNPDGGAWIVGSNGFALIVIADDHAKCGAPVLLSPASDLIEQAPRVGDKLDTPLATLALCELDGVPALQLHDNDGVRCRMQTADAVLPLGDGGQPQLKWRQVLPNFEQLSPGAADPVNPLFLAAALRGWPSTGQPIVSPMQTGAGGAVVYRVAQHPHVLLLVMPQRSDDADTAPAWAELWAPVRQPVLAEMPAGE